MTTQKKVAGPKLSLPDLDRADDLDGLAALIAAVAKNGSEAA